MSKKLRGRPIYITSGDITVSLVPEITMRRWRLGSRKRTVTMDVYRPSAVYVINGEGVHRLNFGDNQAWIKTLLFVTALLLPLPLRLLTRNRGQEHE